MPTGIITRRRTALAPSGTAWTPASLPNLQLWLDASTYGLSDGAAISTTWTDQAGLGNATPTGGLTYRATGIGSQPAVEFNGTSGLYTIAHRTGLSFQSRLFVAMVIRTGVVTANHTLFSKGDSSADPDYILQIGVASGGLSFYDGTAFRSGTASVMAASTSYIIEMYGDGSNANFTVANSGAGSPASTIAYATSTHSLRVGVQGSGTTNLWDGRIAELILCGNGVADGSGATTSGNRTLTHSYLATKYGLS